MASQSGLKIGGIVDGELVTPCQCENDFFVVLPVYYDAKSVKSTEEVSGILGFDAPSPFGTDKDVADLIPENSRYDSLLSSNAGCYSVYSLGGLLVGKAPSQGHGRVYDDGH